MKELSEREREIMQLLTKGFRDRDIAKICTMDY
ncbi:LuxR C-terminal-related transcriptional regulator [Chamaesiphon minutus]